MARLTLVDSSYFIRALTLKKDPFEGLESYSADYDFAICEVVWIEVLRGRTHPKLRDRFEEGFSAMIFLQLPRPGGAMPPGWPGNSIARVVPFL